MQHNERLGVAIVGDAVDRASPDGATGGAIAWITAAAEQRHDLDVHLIDPSVPARSSPFVPDRALPASPNGTLMVLATAEAYVVPIPGNAPGFPRAVRDALDTHPDEWWAKPVAFVTAGGPPRGVHALGHLLGAFVAVGAVPLRDTVHVPDHSSRSVGVPGQLRCATRALFDELVRWGHALHEARTRRLLRA